MAFAFQLCGVGVLAAATMGCELIGGIDQRSLASTAKDSGVDAARTPDASVKDSGGGDAEAGSGEAGAPPDNLLSCTVPGSGTGLARLGNFVASTTRVDVCMRPSSAPTFASVKPIFASAGNNCAAGLGYKDVTVPLKMAPDTYEVHVIPAGSACDATPLATLTSALLVDQQPTAFYLFGNGSQAPTLRRFVESRPTGSGSADVRLVHAAPDLGALDFGVAGGSSLPTMIAIPRIQKVSFGQANPNDPTQTAVDANGYVGQQLGSGTLPYAVAPTGSTNAQLVAPRNVVAGESFSFFAVGRTMVPDFPLQLFACDEVSMSNSVLANCADAPPVTFTVDSVNVQLSGALAPAEPSRRPAAIAAVAALTSDVVCVSEIYQQADKDSVVAAVKSQFPYSYSPALTESTTATNPNNLAGVPYVYATTAACSSSTAGMNAFVDCLRDSCSTKAGDETSIAIENVAGCSQNQCFTQALNLLGGTANDSACFGCVIANLNSYEQMGDIRTRCTSDTHAALGFRGQSGVLILSRRPLTGTGDYVLPPVSIWQTASARATTVLDNGASVDLYCVDGASVPTDCSLYGKSAPSISGFNADGTPPKDCIQAGVNEQLLHNTRIRDWVTTSSISAGKQVVVSGDWYSGPAYQSSVQALQPTNFAVISAAFSLGTATSFTPECTDCAANPIRTPPGGTPSGDNTWTRFNLLQNIPVTAAQSNLVFLKDATVSADPGNGAKKIPISTYYAFRSVLTIVP